MMPIQRIISPSISPDLLPLEIDQMIFAKFSFLDVLRLKTISKVYRDYAQQMTDKYVQRPTSKAYGEFRNLLYRLNFENNLDKKEFLKNCTNQSFLTAILITISTSHSYLWAKPQKAPSVESDSGQLRKDVKTLKKLKTYIEYRQTFKKNAEELLKKFVSDSMADKIRNSQQLTLPHMCHLWRQELQIPGCLIEPTFNYSNIYHFASDLVIQNIPIGYYYSGLALRFRLDCDGNNDKALKHFLMATIDNISGAFFEAGALCEKLENNLPFAMKCYAKAAELGNVDAQNDLASILLDQNEIEKGIKWLVKAAAQGDPMSQCNMGSLYNVGKFLKKDRLKALEWLKLAAKQGEPDAVKLLAKLENEIVDNPP